MAKAHGASPTQIALAWLLQRSPLMLPIPGTSSIEHLEQNIAAASLRLTEEEYEELASVPEQMGLQGNNVAECETLVMSGGTQNSQ